MSVEGLISRETIPGAMGEYPWPADSPQVREFVEEIQREGWMVSSVVGSRRALLRYEAFVRETFHVDIDHAGWREFVAYRTHVIQGGRKRSTVARYLQTVVTYYRVKAEVSQSPEAFDTYLRVRVSGQVHRKLSEHFEPFSPATLHRIMSTAYRGYRWGPPGDHMKEDYPFLLTLLYTGGRAQFYGLKVKELDFKARMIRTTVKGGHPLVLPIHPELALTLREHLARRPFQSEFLFRLGKDPNTRSGSHQNGLNAYAACQRVKKAAQLDEPVSPQRFRVTLAILGRRLGLEPQVIQALLGHRHLSLTMDVYSRVQPDEASQVFSKIDLTKNLPEPTSESEAGGDSTEALLRLIPKDKTEAVNTILRGLIGLMQSSSLDAHRSDRELRRFRQLLLPEAGA